MGIIQEVSSRERHAHVSSLNAILSTQMITSDIHESKRRIQLEAEKHFRGRHFNVICAKEEFSFVTHTELYCQGSGEGSTCYAFSPL
jgi:Ground-like domain